MSFKSFQFHSDIQSGINAVGYTAPTAIQLQAIPIILQNKDLIGVAQTGTGKTAAFALPILQRFTMRPGKGIRALIVAPTRELAEQIRKDIVDLGRYTKTRSATVYGGVSKNPQIGKLRRGVEIVVACPGRLLDLMNQGEVDLSSVEVLVLDEADRMFDMGFLPDIRRILKRVPVVRQTLLFSATMPQDVRTLAQECLRKPVTVQIGHEGPVSSVSHALYPVEPHLKTALLMKLLHCTNTESVLVFTRTKHRATRLAAQMKRAGFPATVMQGDMSQQHREEALAGFRKGTYRILVATDIAARGIDVSCISHVINYDMPDTVDGYTHRIGRTGRAEKTGNAFSFVTSDDKTSVMDLEWVLGEKLESRIVEEFNYNVPPPSRDAHSRPLGGNGAHRGFSPSTPNGAIHSPSREVMVDAGAGGGLFRGTLPYSSPRPRPRRKGAVG
jgi:ATP-dependent RNA helicase RhlE